MIISAGTVTIQTLISNSSVTLSGGTLTLNGDSQINGAFVFSGGTLTGAGALTAGWIRQSVERWER